MKVISYLIITLFLITFSYCSKDNPTAPGDGGGLGGGGTGNVTFTVAVVQDNQQQLYFEFKPNKDIVVEQIKAKCQAINVDETIQDNSGDVYNANSPLYIGPAQGLQSGQQWTFNLKGKIGSTTGQAFDVNFNYTIP